MSINVFAPSGYIAPQVHQAEGVLSVRLGISVPEAVLALQTMAHRAGTSLIDEAQRVLAEIGSAA